MLGYNSGMFLPVSMPGTVVGGFTEEVQKEVGFNCTVVLPATHDTGSAVLADADKRRRCGVYQFRHMVADGNRAKRSGLLHGEYEGKLYK